MAATKSAFGDDTAFMQEEGPPNAFGIDTEYQREEGLFVDIGDDPSQTDKSKSEDVDDDSDSDDVHQRTDSRQAGREIDEILVDRARQVGFSDEEIQKFGSPEILENAVDIVLSKFVAMGKDNAPPSTDGKPRQTESDQKGDEEIIPAPELKYDQDLDPEHYQHNLKSLVTYIDKKIARLDDALKRQTEEQRKRNAYDAMRKFDTAMSKKAKQGFEKWIGSGPTKLLSTANPAHYAMRIEVANMIGILEAGFAKAGKEADFDSLFDGAFHYVLKDKIREVDQKKAQKKRKARGKALKPTDRTGSEMRRGDEEAESFVDNFFAQRDAGPETPLNMGFDF